MYIPLQVDLISLYMTVPNAIVCRISYEHMKVPHIYVAGFAGLTAQLFDLAHAHNILSRRSCDDVATSMYDPAVSC